MSDDEWISLRIAKAKAGLSLVTPAVVEKIQDLLKGPLSERELPKGELTSIAKDLVTRIGPAQQEVKPQP